MRPTILVFVLLALLMGAGCGSGGSDAVPPETQKKSDRLSEIQSKSGGDWSKLEPADKDYLVNTLAHGSEGTAKMLLGPQKSKHP